MSKQDRKEVSNVYFFSLIVNVFFDSWIFMLAMGGIAHMTGVAWLAFGFWLSLLVKLASACLIPQEYLANMALMKLVERA